MKRFKSFFAFVITYFISLNITSGQSGEGPSRFKEIESQRIAFISREVLLTPAEAQHFWPVYNEYSEKRAGLMQKHRQERKAMENLEGKPESEILRIAETDIVHMEEMTALRRLYHQKFLKVLPAVKVVKLYEAERDFPRELRRQRETKGRGRD